MGVVRPDLDQVAGANRNLYPVQRWLDASNADFGVTLVTPDLPLWELNGLTAEAFHQPQGREAWLTHSLPGTELIAYAMNNYWHTNYKADQPGPVTFRVVLLPHGPFDAVDGHACRDRRDGAAGDRAGRDGRRAAGRCCSRATTGSSCRAWREPRRRRHDGAALESRHRRGDSTTLSRQAGTTRVWLSSPAEERGGEVQGAITVAGQGVVTIRVEH